MSWERSYLDYFKYLSCLILHCFSILVKTVFLIFFNEIIAYVHWSFLMIICIKVNQEKRVSNLHLEKNWFIMIITSIISLCQLWWSTYDSSVVRYFRSQEHSHLLQFVWTRTAHWFQDHIEVISVFAVTIHLRWEIQDILLLKVLWTRKEKWW